MRGRVDARPQDTSATHILLSRGQTENALRADFPRACEPWSHFMTWAAQIWRDVCIILGHNHAVTPCNCPAQEWHARLRENDDTAPLDAGSFAETACHEDPRSLRPQLLERSSQEHTSNAIQKLVPESSGPVCRIPRDAA